MLEATFEIVSGNSYWGNIGGDIENQTDLQEALAKKADKSDLDADVEIINQTINENYNTLDSKIDNVQSELSGDISDLETAIQNEATTRANNDTLLQGDINTLQTDLTSEITNRTTADTTLQNNINTLSGTVSSNFTTLDTKIDNTKTALDGDISDLSNTVSQNYTDLNNAITTTASTINNRIDSEVSTLNIAITTENTQRQAADNNLQSQIDAITSASDVFDIVGTYAELQSYDITSVPVNDIIKVLVDSTHNNAATYYRCVENDGVKTWTYIGSEGAYYTKSEADNKFVDKTTTINNKPLSSNITLTASDINALPADTVIGAGVITLQKNGTAIDSFNVNATANKSINISVPTDTSDLTNNAGFITSSALNGYATESFVTGQGYITGITSSDVTTALGFTPYNATNPNGYITNSALADYQPLLVSGTNIKTINNQSLLGSGDITIQAGGTVDQTYDPTSTNAQSGTAVTEALETKQDKLAPKNAGNGINIYEYYPDRVPVDYHIYDSNGQLVECEVTTPSAWSTTPQETWAISLTGQIDNLSNRAFEFVALVPYVVNAGIALACLGNSYPRYSGVRIYSASSTSFEVSMGVGGQVEDGVVTNISNDEYLQILSNNGIWFKIVSDGAGNYGAYYSLDNSNWVELISNDRHFRPLSVVAPFIGSYPAGYAITFDLTQATFQYTPARDPYTKVEVDTSVVATKSDLPDLTNYYTQTETDNLLNKKQDKLTAGEGINIEVRNPNQIVNAYYAPNFTDLDFTTPMTELQAENVTPDFSSNPQVAVWQVVNGIDTTKTWELQFHIPYVANPNYSYGCETIYITFNNKNITSSGALPNYSQFEQCIILTPRDRDNSYYINAGEGLRQTSTSLTGLYVKIVKSDINGSSATYTVYTRETKQDEWTSIGSNVRDNYYGATNSNSSINIGMLNTVSQRTKYPIDLTSFRFIYTPALPDETYISVDTSVVATKSELPDLTNYALKSEIPTNNNQLTNGAGYITSSALNGYALLSSLATVATSGSYNDLSNKPTIPSAVTENTVSGWGFTKNTGTVTSVNNVSPVNGNVTIAIPSTAGLENTSNKVTSLSSSSTDTQYPSAKCVYDLVGNIETLLSEV